MNDNGLEYFFEQNATYVSESLARVLVNDTPPPAEFIKECPSILDFSDHFLYRHHIDYGILLEKPGCKPRLYPGSAAGQARGAFDRVQDYKLERVSTYSQRTRESIDQGFKITHIGVLVAMPKKPRVSPNLTPVARLWALFLEACFTYWLWALYRGAQRTIENHFRKWQALSR